MMEGKFSAGRGVVWAPYQTSASCRLAGAGATPPSFFASHAMFMNESSDDTTITHAAHILSQLRAGGVDDGLMNVRAEESQRLNQDAGNRLLPPKKRPRAELDKEVLKTSAVPLSPHISPRDGAELHSAPRTPDFHSELAAPSPRLIVIIKPLASPAPQRTSRKRRPVADRKVDFSLLPPDHRAMFEFYAGGKGTRDFVAVTTRENCAELPWTRDAHRVREMENGAVVYWIQGERPHPRALAFRSKAVPVLMGFFSPSSRR